MTIISLNWWVLHWQTSNGTGTFNGLRTGPSWWLWVGAVIVGSAMLLARRTGAWHGLFGCNRTWQWKKIPIYKWLSLVKPPFIENSHCDVSLRKGTRLHVAVLLLVLEIPGGKLGEISPVSASQAKSRSEQWRWLGLWSLWAQNLLWLDGKLTELQGIEALETSEGRCSVTISRRKSIILPHSWCVHVAFSGELKRYKIWIIHCAARCTRLHVPTWAADSW